MPTSPSCPRVPAHKRCLAASLAKWEQLILQEEWHHAWPKWRGGQELPARQLYLPRCLHNFKGVDDFKGGFHQAFKTEFSDGAGP